MEARPMSACRYAGAGKLGKYEWKLMGTWHLGLAGKKATPIPMSASCRSEPPGPDVDITTQDLRACHWDSSPEDIRRTRRAIAGGAAGAVSIAFQMRADFGRLVTSNQKSEE
eukprot:3042915-Pyramimonas_sp.AAC.1